MANREPRWSPTDTWEAAVSNTNLLDKHKDKLTNALTEDGGVEGMREKLTAKGNAVRELEQTIQAGEVDPPPQADYLLAAEEVPLIVRAVREMIKRSYGGDLDVRAAFGVGTGLNPSSDKSMLQAISKINTGAELYPEVASKAPAELIQAAQKHEETLLAVVSSNLPSANQPNLDIAKRNAVQVEVQDLVDGVLAEVAVHCWRTPEVLAEFKAALPKRISRG